MEENKLTVTKYEVLGKLPDIFTFEDGSPVKTKEDWQKRRKELYKSVVELQYGTMPPEPEFLEVERLNDHPKATTYKITTGPKNHPVSFTMKVIRPQPCPEKFPVIVDGDLCWLYAFDKEWLNAPLSKGIGLVMFDRTELAHDIQHEGRRKGQLYDAYPDYTFGAIGAWAWGFSRCLDAAIKAGFVDESCITFTGHSRGGKTAMLAGILDERAHIVCPNETNAGSCSCYRSHLWGEYNGKEGRSEHLKDLWNNFGFWMGEGMQEYTDREQDLPFDCHFTKAMIAPRTLFVAEAAGDMWTNPFGTYQTTMAAKEVWKFLGEKENDLYWYFRDGYHSHNVEDLELTVNLIEHKMKGVPLSDKFGRLPFDAPPLNHDPHDF